MKTPGDYALMHANGMPWKDVVELIRAEAIAPYVGTWDAPDARPGTTDHTLLQSKDDE